MGGRTVKIYLVSGEANEIMTAEIMNWTGKFIVGPRLKLIDLLKRPELRRTGVYFLVGQNPDDPEQPTVYIGESDNIAKRLLQHSADTSKEFWEKTIVVTSKDDNLTKAHGRYLESQLINLAVQAQRSKVINGTNPELTSLPETDTADMEYFLEQIKMILPVLGFTFAVPIPKTNPSRNSENSNIVSPIWHLSYLSANKEIRADAQEVNGEFIVFKGSTARKTVTPTCPLSYIQLRERLKKEGNLIDSQNPDSLEFTKDVPFQSPSQAAGVVSGASINGRTNWKLKDTTQTYAQWQEEQINKIEPVESIQEL
jgi:hypothetical protein